MSEPAKKLGRPPKPDKFDESISFPCHRALIDAIEAYRKAKGMRSHAEVCRSILERETKAKGGK